MSSAATRGRPCSSLRRGRTTPCFSTFSHFHVLCRRPETTFRVHNSGHPAAFGELCLTGRSSATSEQQRRSPTRTVRQRDRQRTSAHGHKQLRAERLVGSTREPRSSRGSTSIDLYRRLLLSQDCARRAVRINDAWILMTYDEVYARPF